ncbi:MAG: hypothetical protein V1919_04280 [Candidatus Omnitrophota bacterium]
MEDNKNKINPFTNQPITPTPLSPSQGKIKNISPALKETKADKPVSKLDLKIVFLYIILLGLGWILAQYAFDFFAPGRAKPTGPQSQKAAVKASSHPLIKLIPKKQQANTPPAPAAGKKEDHPLLSIKKKINQTVTPFVLSGIFSSGEKSYCIINDKILEQGDSIEGAKITRINLDEVELQLNDKSLKLNLRGK